MAGQVMVGVDGDLVAFDLCDLHHQGPLRRFGVELHAGLDLVNTGEGFHGNLLDKFIATRAVALFGVDLDLHFFPFALAFKRFLESGDDVAVPVKVREGFAAFRGIDDLTFVIRQRVVDGYDGIAFSLHGISCLFEWSYMVTPAPDVPGRSLIEENV